MCLSVPRLRRLRCVVLLAVCAPVFSAPAAIAQTSGVAIHDIMKNLPLNSPYLNKTVSVSGVVVGVLSTGGFYITAPNAAWDADSTTAEGIEVFGSSTVDLSCAVVGNVVSVAGTVVNGTAVNGADTPGTGINPTSCSVVGTGAVSSTVSLTSAASYATDLPYTGMPAANTNFYAISPTGGSAPDPATGLVTSNGQFWVDIAKPTNGHLFKSAGLEADEFYPTSPPAPAKGSLPGIPTWDGNPERLFVDTTSFGGAPVDIAAGQVLTCTAGKNLTLGATAGIGVIDYSLGYNRLLIFKTTTCTVSGSPSATITSPADTKHFHVGTLNLMSFRNSSVAGYAIRKAKAALAIVNVFGAPDILSIQGVQDQATLQDIADAANALGGTSYVAYLSPQTNDATNLSIGFLVNQYTVLVSKDYVVNASDTFTKFDGSTEPLFERPSYVLEAYLLRAGQNYQVEVINIHITERAGIDDPVNGPNVWMRRAEQAAAISVFEQQEQTRGQNVIIAGEFNAYSFSDGFADPTDIIDGSNPSPQGKVAWSEPTSTSPTMYNFVNSIDVSNSTYNVLENGNARSIEHVLCSTTDNASQTGSLYSYIDFVTQPHWTTDFPAVDANDPTISAGLTSRDGFVGAFLIPPVPTTASVDLQAVDFGNVYRGESSQPAKAKFTNTSTFPSTVNITSITITGANPADFSQTSDCTSITDGSSCMISIVFTPTAAGVRTATLTVNSDSGKNPTVTTTLTGTGLDTTATLSPASATLPSTQVTGVSAAQNFTFTNTSPLTETVSAVSASGDFAATNNCGTVAPGGTCTVAVTFHPTAAGTRTGTLTVANSSTGNPLLTASLTAIGLDTTATLTPASATYPTTADGDTSVAQTFTWKNTSAVVLTVQTPVLTGDFAVSATSCSGSIAVGGSCTVAVVFRPTLSGPRTGTLKVQSSSTANPSLTATLTGTGAPNIGATPVVLMFGKEDVGRLSSAQVVTISNYSTHSITLGAVSVAGDYAASSQCGAVLAGGASCTISVTFQPSAVGTRAGSLSMPTSDAATPILTVPLTGDGVDFTLSVVPGSATIVAGTWTNMQATLTPLNGYVGPISTACDPPANEGGSTCNTWGGHTITDGPVQFPILVSTTSQYKIIGYEGFRGYWPVGGAILSLLMLTMARRRRLLRVVALGALLVAVGMTNMGCTGKLPDRNADPTYPGTYTYTVTATDGFLTHTATFDLTVKINNHS